MQVEGKRSRVFRSSDWTWDNQDRRREDKRSIGLADSERSLRYTEVFGTHQLLLAVHQRFCSDSQTFV